jgi:hypothetical protein
MLAVVGAGGGNNGLERFFSKGGAVIIVAIRTRVSEEWSRVRVQDALLTRNEMAEVQKGKQDIPNAK